MQNKSKKRWLDVQVILASLAVTFTVGLWNLFARANRPVANPVVPPPPDPAFTITYAPTPIATAMAAQDPNAPIRLPKLHLLLGGTLPVPKVVLAAIPSADSGNQTTGPVGGSHTNPPPPVTNTTSSRP
jgi:hypothetical protein